MDCMQCINYYDALARKSFQYRKRYGLHAIGTHYFRLSQEDRFNTASGMDCMQLKS